MSKNNLTTAEMELTKIHLKEFKTIPEFDALCDCLFGYASGQDTYEKQLNIVRNIINKQK